MIASMPAPNPTLTPARHIRKNVLGFRTQQAFADVLGVTQFAVSDWEIKGRFPPEIQARIRAMGIDRLGASWSDTLFFEVPAVIIEASDET